MKKDVFWLVIGCGWSRDWTWVGLMGLQICLGMSHVLWQCGVVDIVWWSAGVVPAWTTKVDYRMKKDVF